MIEPIAPAPTIAYSTVCMCVIADEQKEGSASVVGLTMEHVSRCDVWVLA